MGSCRAGVLQRCYHGVYMKVSKKTGAPFCEIKDHNTFRSKLGSSMFLESPVSTFRISGPYVGTVGSTVGLWDHPWGPGRGLGVIYGAALTSPPPLPPRMVEGLSFRVLGFRV